MIDTISVYIYFSLNLKFTKRATTKKTYFAHLYRFYIKICLRSLPLFYDAFVLH